MDPFVIATSLALLSFGSVNADDTPARRWSDELFDSLSHDFGTVARGYCTTKFKITNTMDKPLHILKIDPRGMWDSRARYVEVKAEKDWIEPGESVWLKVGVQTSWSLSQAGALLIVTFDQPKYGSSNIKLNWSARSDIVFDPPKISFGAVKNDSRLEKTMAIEYAGEFVWKIATATCKNPYVEVRLQEKHRERTEKDHATVGYELVVSLLPGAPPGKLQESIELEINDKYSKTLQVVVEGTVDAEGTEVTQRMGRGRS